MRVICFGDSNTFGYDPRSYFGGRYPAEHRWVDLLSRKTGWEIGNAGENGRGIPGHEREIGQIIRMVEEWRPDRFVVMLGSNDLLQGADVDAVTARMEGFLTRLPLEKDRILLIAPPPMEPGEWVTEPRLIPASKQLAQRYQSLALRLGVGFADAGRWGVSLTYDGVHFTEEGHMAFSDGIYRCLNGEKEKEGC